MVMLASLVVHWLVAAVAVMIAAYLLPGVALDGWIPAFVTALVLGIVNTLLRPLFIVLTLPLTLLTFGLFTFVINAFLVWLTNVVVPGFDVASFWWAFLFSVVLSVVHAGITWFSHQGTQAQRVVTD
jgi:putative membrane protein